MAPVWRAGCRPPARHFPMTFTARQKLEWLERELLRRICVSKNRALTKRMSPTRIAYDLAICKAIRNDYSALERGERLL